MLNESAGENVTFGDIQSYYKVEMYNFNSFEKLRVSIYY
jgi:hypothetical protein